MEQPPLGWTTTAEILQTTDGDTVKVRIYKDFIIRLTNDKIYFDAPETYRPSCEEERAEGKKALEYLKSLILDKKIVVFIPTDGANQMKDVTHLSRFDGVIFADGVDIVEEMIKAGFVKQPKTKHPK